MSSYTIFGTKAKFGFERTIGVQAICIPLKFLMLSVGILMAGDPTKPLLALRVILVHFATKTHL
jgi:hypothetical protein